MLWFVGFLIFLGVVVIFAYKSKSKDSRATDVNETEAAKIIRIAEERKIRARDLGVEKVVLVLFFSRGSKALNPDELRKSSIVTNITEDTKDEKFIKYSFRLRNKTFKCVYDVAASLFELYVDGKKSLSIVMFQEDIGSSDLLYWSCIKFEGFIEGEWVQDLKDLIQQNAADTSEKEKKEKESSARIKKLKEDFGI